MKNPTMVLRYPGSKAQLQDGSYDYLIVEAEDVEAALVDGWYRTAAEAKEAGTPKVEAPVEVPADDTPPTRAELEQKAAEIGLKVDGRWSDKKLGEAIAAALKV